MKALSLLLWLVGAPVQAAPGVFAGHVAKTGHQISTELGLEHWKGGVKADRTFTKWLLSCGESGDGKTDCTVAETRFRRTSGITEVVAQSYSAADGGLQMKSADWSKGRIQFTLRETPTRTVGVSLRLATRGNGIYVTGLETQAYGAEGKRTGAEMRIADTTYEIPITVEMPGLNPKAAP